jgi:GntR family transcriptional regulator/MocR family aminotransferase
VVIEDDYDGEFRYDRQPVGALQGLDPDRVVYAGTASKTLAPGLRLGWFALPGRLVEPVVEAKRLADYGTGVLDQLALAELIDDGDLDRHVRRMRVRYRRRRDIVMAMLAQRAPGLRVFGVAAGLHLVIELPEGGPTEDELIAVAGERSLAIGRLGSFHFEPEGRTQGLVVGNARPPEHAFGQAVASLGDVLALAGR